MKNRRILDGSTLKYQRKSWLFGRWKTIKEISVEEQLREEANIEVHYDSTGFDRFARSFIEENRETPHN